MKGITMVLILGFIALAVILPATAAGQGGNGKMLQTGATPQDGTGNQHGGAVFQNGGNQAGQQGGNGTCIREDCPNNQTPPQDGTGMQYGKNVNNQAR
jgi:hypothetical protein